MPALRRASQAIASLADLPRGGDEEASHDARHGREGVDDVGQDLDRGLGLDGQHRLMDRLGSTGTGDEGAEPYAAPAVDDDRYLAAGLGDIALGAGGKVGDLLNGVVTGRQRLLEGEPTPAVSGSVYVACGSAP
jgi:hypothetical protein